jgi:riboflavin synthase
MFTGIVTHRGTIEELRDGSPTEIVVASGLPLDEVPLGASVAHSGVCLTLVEKGRGWHRVQASGETLARTTIGGWRLGMRINLERSLRLGDELGGHLVFGHVDGVGRLERLEPEAGGWRLEVGVPASLLPLMAVKGSVAIDGISLTVTEVTADSLAAAIIPHTYEETTLPDRRVGDPVNLEADMLARYVARQMGMLRK